MCGNGLCGLDLCTILCILVIIAVLTSLCGA